MGILSYVIAGLSLATVVCAEPKAPVCKEKLVIISPHRKSTQIEFVEAFKEHYLKTYTCSIVVDWLDQGGASDDMKFVLSRFERTPASCGVDVFWGGGEHPHYELNRRKLSLPFILSPELKKEVPPVVAGVALYNKEETWHAAALSSFGLFFNKTLLKKLKISEPEDWQDLADPVFMDHLSNADPRRSSSNVTMTMVLLQAYGWQKGWEILSGIAANTRSFTHSSSDPIKAVVTGDALASMSVGFYAIAKVSELGSDKLAYVFPAKHSILNPDPISILKGAANQQAAERFIEFVLSASGQKLFLLPQGMEGGPKHSSLARMSVNKRAYSETKVKNISELDPFALQISPMMLDVDRVTTLQFIFTDLLGAVQIDSHKELKKAWQMMIKRGNKAQDRALLAAPPLSEAELLALAEKWSDAKLRNEVINQWVKTTAKKYDDYVKNAQ